MDLLDNYFEAQFQNTRSMLCGVYQPTIVLVESYLDTTSRHPFGCEWESMPKTAARDRTSLLLALHDAVAWLCSEPIAEAFAPEIVIRSKDGLDKYGQSISEGFHAKTR
jgi:hypothetical protein